MSRSLYWHRSAAPAVVHSLGLVLRQDSHPREYSATIVLGHTADEMTALYEKSPSLTPVRVRVDTA
jgi:hypothetical protein